MSKEIDIEYYHQLALQKQKEHRKFLGNLKKKAPKNLDKIRLRWRFTKKCLKKLIVQPVLTVARALDQTLKKQTSHALPSTLK